MDVIEQAADLLRRGELVAFPTETVYGLGADATNQTAVRKIFAAKGRPSTNPLIAHVANVATARKYAKNWNDRAEKLAQHFWPGALTLVLDKHPAIVDEATAGLSTVGLRVPNHPVALRLLRAFSGAVAAPSANRSNRISPTCADHVRSEFGNAIPLIIDGGPCEIGIESTVLDLTALPRILRPGAITQEMIESVLSENVANKIIVQSTEKAAQSPGQSPLHYSPQKPSFRFDADQLDEVRRRLPSWPGAILIAMDGGSPEVYAHDLYARLRTADATAEMILIEMPPDEPRWMAVRDRLLRATKPLKLSDLP